MLRLGSLWTVFGLLGCSGLLPCWGQVGSYGGAAEMKVSAGSQLFEKDSVFDLSLMGNLSKLFSDIGEKNSYHPFRLSYIGEKGKVNLPVEIRTRGHYRKQKGICSMPPLLLDFKNDSSSRTHLFSGQRKLKLVVPCKGDAYVIREYLVYKLFNLISPESFRDRLVRVTFEDSAHQIPVSTHYCFLLEEESHMALRNGDSVWKKTREVPNHLKRQQYRQMAVFQYMIGNTDWGVPFLQNIVLIGPDSLGALCAVPYDFDQAGIVDAPYAAPHAELGISSNLVRLYRGLCEADLHQLDSTFSLFNRLRPRFYEVYDSCALITAGYRKFVHRFLDGFYHTINHKNEIQKEFSTPCDLTQPVEIKGLKN